MLKGLVLRKKANGLNSELTEINNQLNEIVENEKKLALDIEAREELTDEEMRAIEEEVDSNESKKEELEARKKELEEELAEINKELEELEGKTDEVAPTEAEKERKENIKLEKRGITNMKLEKREQLRQLVQNEENRNFFETVANVVNNRATPTTEIKNKEILIPEEVMTLINQEIIGYGEVVKLVNKVTLNGTGRIIFNAGTPKLFWTEMCADLKEAVLGEINQIEVDGFKLGGYVFLCKAFIEDAMIDIANYVINEFAQAIAIALDEAIVNGKGATEKEPEGILTALATDEEVVAKDILGVLTSIGGLNPKAKNITLLVNRKTYYTRVLPETYGKDSSGKIVYGLGQTLPDGTKVIISEAVKDDKFIVGDFKQYLLAERKGMTFDTSDQVRWIEEQIGYKTSGRYDGKVVDKTYFVKGNFTNTISA